MEMEKAMSQRQILCLFIWMSGGLWIPQVIQPSLGGPASLPRHVIILDCSGSMDGDNRMAATREAAKLAVEILGQSTELSIIRFNDTATVSPTFNLATERVTARNWIDTIQPAGGTSYLSALRAIPQDASAVLFLSDGAPQESSEEILSELKSFRCPLHFIAVQPDANAQQLLVRMAATCQGGYYQVAQPDQVLEAFLQVLGQTRQFFRLSMQGSSFQALDVRGRFLAIGVGTEPEVSDASSRFVARLPNETIHLVQSNSPQLRNVTVTRDVGHETKNVVVIRFDLPKPSLRLTREQRDHGETVLLPELTFWDAAGQQVALDGHAKISAEFELLDVDGRRVQSFPAVLAGQKSLSGRVELPTGSADKPWILRSIVHNGETHQRFVTMMDQTVQPTQLPFEPAIPELAPSMDQLQLLVVAARKSGRAVLFDSEQKHLDRPALVGDPLHIELVRGELDPRVFVGISSGLRAKFIGEDGAVRQIPLEHRGNAYVSAPVVMPQPGRLKVHVDIAVQGLHVAFSAEILISDVNLGLEVSAPILTSTGGHLPLGALVPFRMKVRGTTAGQSSTETEFAEIIHRRGVICRWDIHDSADNLIGQGEQSAQAGEWQSQIGLERSGSQVVSFRILDREGRLLDGTTTAIEVTSPPVTFQPMQVGPSGPSPIAPTSGPATWLPAWLTWSPECVVVARPVDSEFSTMYYVSDLSVGGQEAEFNESRGFFVSHVLPRGTVEAASRLTPYQFGGDDVSLPEIQVVRPVELHPPVYVRWGRLVLASGMGLVLVGGASAAALTGWGRRRLLRLRQADARVSLWGPISDERLLINPEQRTWPRAVLYVCTEPRHSSGYRLAYPDDANGFPVVARLVQRLDGSVKLVAHRDLQGLRKGQSRILQYGSEPIQLDSETTLSVNMRPIPQMS